MLPDEFSESGKTGNRTVPDERTLVHCLDCEHFFLRGNRDMAKHGFGLCASKRNNFEFQSALFPRECRRWDAAPEGVVSNRRQWLEQREVRKTTKEI